MSQETRNAISFPPRQTRRPDGAFSFSYADRIVQTKKPLDFGASEVEAQGRTGVDGAIVEALSEIRAPDWSNPAETESWVNEIVHQPLRQTRKLADLGRSRGQILLRQASFPVFSGVRANRPIPNTYSTRALIEL